MLYKPELGRYVVAGEGDDHYTCLSIKEDAAL